MLKHILVDLAYVILLLQYTHRIGTVGDIYRPVDSQTFPKEFALVGFYDHAHVASAIQCLRSEQFINNVHVVAEEAKPWMLDLYPKK
jgi:hypothetical protein